MALSKITSAGIGTGAISANTFLSSGVITADLIKTGAVGPTELATGAVSANTKLGSGIITAVNLAADSVSNVHSLDNKKLADKISNQQEVLKTKTKIFIQVNIGREEQKS